MTGRKMHMKAGLLVSFFLIYDLISKGFILSLEFLPVALVASALGLYCLMCSSLPETVAIESFPFDFFPGTATDVSGEYLYGTSNWRSGRQSYLWSPFCRSGIYFPSGARCAYACGTSDCGVVSEFELILNLTTTFAIQNRSCPARRRRAIVSKY